MGGARRGAPPTQIDLEAAGVTRFVVATLVRGRRRRGRRGRGGIRCGDTSFRARLVGGRVNHTIATGLFGLNGRRRRLRRGRHRYWRLTLGVFVVVRVVRLRNDADAVVVLDLAGRAAFGRRRGRSAVRRAPAGRVVRRSARSGLLFLRLLTREDLHAAIFSVETEPKEAGVHLGDERTHPNGLVLLLLGLLYRRKTLARISRGRDFPVPYRSQRLLTFGDGAQQHGVEPSCVLLVLCGYHQLAVRRLLHERVDAKRVTRDRLSDLFEPVLVLVCTGDVFRRPEQHLLHDHFADRGVTTDFGGHFGHHCGVIGSLEGDRNGGGELPLLGVACLDRTNRVIDERIRLTLRFGGDEVDCRVESDGTGLPVVRRSGRKGSPVGVRQRRSGTSEQGENCRESENRTSHAARKQQCDEDTHHEHDRSDDRNDPPQPPEGSQEEQNQDTGERTPEGVTLDKPDDQTDESESGHEVTGDAHCAPPSLWSLLPMRDLRLSTARRPALRRLMVSCGSVVSRP